MVGNETDRQRMVRALQLARREAGRVEPNPMVGAVLCRSGEIIGEGAHRRYGGPHAEVNALEDARSRGHQTKGSTMYVTLEPCAHHGKTPPCAPALVEAGLRRVVIAMEDPLWQRHARESDVGEEGPRGVTILKRAGVDVQTGLCRSEACLLNAAFLKHSATDLPLVIAKWAMSADGKIATRTGSSRWISGPESRQRVHELRGRVDAVIVGSGTARRDDPRLTCRDAEARRTAARVVLCGASLPAADSQLVRTSHQAPVLLAHRNDAPPPGLQELIETGCEPLPVPSAPGRAAAVDPAAVLARLGAREMANVLIEGGSDVLGSFFDAHLVDRVLVFMAPMVIGGTDAVTAVGGAGPKTVRGGTALCGPTVSGVENRLPAEPQTRVSVFGKDVVLEGWTRDPRNWLPAGNEKSQK